MLNEIIERLDGREWITALDRSEGGRRLIELVPAGTGGLRFPEVIDLTIVRVGNRVDLRALAESEISRLRQKAPFGTFTPLILKSTTSETAYMVSIDDDALMGDVFMLHRVVQVPGLLVILMYQRLASAESGAKSEWADRLGRIPLQGIVRGSGAPARPALPDRLGPPLPQLRAVVAALTPEQKVLKDFQDQMLNSIDQLSDAEMGVDRLLATLAIFIRILSMNTHAPVITESCQDELIETAELLANFFSNPGLESAFALALSVFARTLVDDPRLLPKSLERGLLVSKMVAELSKDSEATRFEEAALSYLIAANRLDVVTGEDVFFKRSEWLHNLLLSRPVQAGHALARFATKRKFEHAPETDRLLEHLNMADMTTRILDSLPYDPKIDYAVGRLGDPAGLTIDDIFEELRRCPPEFVLGPSTGGDIGRVWPPGQVPFVALRFFACEAAIDAQDALYGISRSENAKFVRGVLQERARRDSVFLRSFRSARRLWLANDFDGSSPDIVPYYSEPPRLTLESAIVKGLGMHFHTMSVGGMPDAYGMGRVLQGGAERSQTEVDWRMAVNVALNVAKLVLVLPDSTAGVAWELGEIQDRGLLPSTVFVMLPESVHRDAARCWKFLGEQLGDEAPRLPHYNATGGFAILDQDNAAFVVIPFSGLFDGRLVRACLLKVPQPEI